MERTIGESVKFNISDDFVVVGTFAGHTYTWPFVLVDSEITLVAGEPINMGYQQFTVSLGDLQSYIPPMARSDVQS